MVLAVLAGLAAAVCNGLAGFLQHGAAKRTTARHALQFRLLAELVRDRRWLAGTLVNAGGLGFQVVALASGPLLLVQPLLVLSLLVIVVARAIGRRSWPRARSVVGALLTCVGLAACLLAARPRPAPAGEVGSDAKAITLGIVLTLLLAGCLVLARWSERNLRAVALAVGAGLAYGVAAGLVKVVAHELSRGVAAPFVTWPLYVMVAVVVLGVQLNQAAFQAGALAAPAAVITVSDQVSSVAVGLALLGETVRTAHGPLELEIAGFAAMVVGIVALAQESPGVSAPSGEAKATRTGGGG